MNQRVPDSGGLPLRAMVMVLLFLAIIFLLLGINAVRTGGNSSNQPIAVATTTATTASSTPAAPKPDVHVYNISGVEGAAARAKVQDKYGNWHFPRVAPGAPGLSIPEGARILFVDKVGSQYTVIAAEGRLASTHE